ncbi:MAG TPA: Mut7-C RNAse domain-containing protein, partial [Parafilimonas sp.]|nr:Mut7-C RNAse domain-containing protein [Parafilimonas sp.]
TKNPALQTNPDLKLFIITNENPEIQLQQVLHHFNLKNFQPFSRCIVCNGLIKPVEKEDIALRLQPNTAKYFDEFWQCENCKGVYWKGSHYERMRKWELGIRN